MKILFYTTVYPDETGTLGGIFIHNQAIALRKAGHEIAVLFIDFRSIRRQRPFGYSAYKLDGIYVYRYAFPCGPVYPVINLMGTFLTDRTFKQVIKTFGKPDLIYAHFGGSAKFVLKTAKMQKIPLVVIEHESALLKDKVEKQKLVERSNTYNQADSVIAVGHSLKNRIQKLTNNMVEVIPNIIPNYMFAHDVPIKKYSSDFMFISVGNLIKRKSFDLTIISFANIVKKYKNAKLIIVGEGAEENDLRRLVNEQAIKDKVEFKGQLNNRMLADLLRTCDCFVLPSKQETFGVVYVEAMACGLPVIATKCGGPEDFINDKNGILIPVDDVEALTKAMFLVIEGKEYDSQYIRDYAYKLSSEEYIVLKLEKIFLNVLETFNYC